ncbi:alpha/beta fold hydrolase [Halopseudomonas maritima]|uniref:alpha/beta fold hydrolase n=1 Tax=Halopseudomonas maritima TaxID=2918528 RepID=UPI0037BE9033|nr:alpha/beta hydrolase [Halopseudomonas maritima]
MPVKTTTALATLALCLAPLASVQAANSYGPQLEGFSYPYPLHRFEFASQQQTLSMGYMDIAPARQANGRTVALLHGKNFCGATWESTIKALSNAGYRVIAPDQIGFCSSSKPRGYQFSFGQLAANTDALLASLNIEKVTVIGHSMGGMLAARYALEHAGRIEQLVMVNPLGLEDWQAEGVPYISIDQLYQSQLKTSYEGIKNYQLKYYYNGIWQPEYDHWVQMLYGMYTGPGKEIVAWNQAQTAEMLLNQPVVHEFPRLTTPTLLMIGGMDRTAPGAYLAPSDVAARLGNYPELGRKAAAAIPNATLVEFPELGHSPQVEAPERFHEALLNGLAQLNH